MHSILGRESFCRNDCFNAAWHGGNQPVALLRCYGGPGCFDSSLKLIHSVGSGVSQLPLHNIPQILYGVQVRRVGRPIEHSNTMVVNHLPVVLALWGGARSCWKMKSSSIKVPESGGRLGKRKCQNAWSPVSSTHSHWWSGMPCQLLCSAVHARTHTVLVHCVLLRAGPIQLAIRR